MNTVLITGGAGFIGSHAAEAFHRLGCNVKVLDDLSSGSLGNLQALNGQARFTFIRGSVDDATALQAAADGASLIVHLAALVSVQESITQPRQSFVRNATGGFNVFEAARQCAQPPAIIYASSAAVYGSLVKDRVAETDPVAPLSPYAADKLYMETLAAVYSQLYAVPSVGFRFFNVYGPRQKPDSPYSGVISKFARAFSNGQPCTIFGDGQQRRDFIHVSDIVRALVEAGAALVRKPAAQSLSGKVFNLGTGQSISIGQLHELLARIYPGRPEPLRQPAPKGEVPHSCADIASIRAQLGWAPQIELEPGLRALLDAAPQ